LIISVSVVLLLGAFVVLLQRHANLRLWHAIVCLLCGFFLASTSLAPHISNAASSVARFIASLHL
jgi:hypothetical protein